MFARLSSMIPVIALMAATAAAAERPNVILLMADDQG
jgi:hypothetical protein